jgi:ribonuclease BN (tRNA processing enzyme)
MFSIQFLGVGNAFTLPIDGDFNKCDWQSNLLLIAESGKKLLLDCGSDIRFSLTQAGYSLGDIDALFVSHAHADHIGGMEWQAFGTYFNPALKRPDLFCADGLDGPLWSESLKGGLESIEGVKVDLTTYYNLRRIPKDEHFVWEGIRCEPIQVVHIISGRSIKHSHGLMLSEEGKQSAKVFWTSDTQYCPNQLKVFYEQADLILHDTETAEFPSGVHAHYNDLKTLDSALKKKMVLYHYHPGAPDRFDAVGDGFMDFALKRDIIIVDDMSIKRMRKY